MVTEISKCFLLAGIMELNALLEFNGMAGGDVPTHLEILNLF